MTIGCATQTSRNTATIRAPGAAPHDWLQELLPADKAESVSFEADVFPASLSQQDVQTLVLLLGRIPFIDKTVVAVRIPWEHPVCAVAVILQGYVVYFVKTMHGWDYSDANYMTDWNVGKSGDRSSTLQNQ